MDTALRGLRDTEAHDPTATRQAVLTLTIARRDAVQTWATTFETVLWFSTSFLYLGVFLLIFAAFIYLSSIY